ncbi:NADPH-dependent FMN reductase [Oceanobacillus sp. J11TS1]|uniref:NADPH-dependent FMN reductase n=1 Tax=Oceanobacillus sp. J11TS1 TaxID=2807191 RepID=UPI001B167EFF|nr:NADPH-dependent FMN reductase [Oceanobacillus sp. J11TS1]GIO21544.1 FMN reductase [Oceanobacillus sp. J11TS1]
MKVAAMIGSNRAESYNKLLVEYMKDRYQDKIEIDILPIQELPFYNQDEELNPPEIVKELRERIKKSDAVLFATPEYNGSISGMLKNAIDWFSRVDLVLVNKPGMIVGASMGVLGTVKAQMQLRQILNSRGVGVLTLPGNEVLIGSVQDKVDEQGKLADEQTIDFLDTVVHNFVQWCNTLQK